MARGAQEGLQVGRQGQRHRRRHSVVVVFSLVGGVVCFRLAPLFFFFFCPLPFAVDAAAQASFDRSSFFSFCFSCRRRCGGSAGGSFLPGACCRSFLFFAASSTSSLF